LTVNSLLPRSFKVAGGPAAGSYSQLLDVLIMTGIRRIGAHPQ